MTDTPFITDVKHGSSTGASIDLAQLTEQVAALTAAVQRIGGYAAAEEWDWVECDGQEPWQRLAPRDGAEALRIECRSDLLIGEVEAIPVAAGTPLREVWRSITPHIRAWNVRALNTETGEWEDVPPPRVMGADAFKFVKPLAAEWMAFVVKFARLRDLTHPKGEQPIDDGPSSPSDSALVSDSPAKPSPKSPKATTSSSATA
jgi:hypothetical protein